MHLLYSLALALALGLTSPWWAWRLLRGRYGSGLRERLGRLPTRLRWPAAGEPGSVWIHAVSVGEVLAVSKLVEELRAREPRRRVFISTTTATGQKLARDRFGSESVFYFPLDFAFAIRPYLRALRPELVVLAETEFWPNFLRLARRSGARVAVVNARISDRSLPRYRAARSLMRRVLAHVDLFLAQSGEDAQRLVAIGAAATRVRVGGNLKFDVQPPAQTPLAEQLRERFERAAAFPVLVCGSTMEGEETALLAIFQALLQPCPNAVMVLAPRRPERFDEVAELVATFSSRADPRRPIWLWRRSQLDPQAVLRGGVLLLDTIGELASVYSLATIAFVGGSLVRHGGHNILEPAWFGVPILVGPHTENFRDVVQIFLRAGAVRVVRAFREGDAKGNFGATLRELLQDDSARDAMGRRAREVMTANAGATARTMQALAELIAAKVEVQP